MSTSSTISIEDALSPPFFKKIPISIERGKGVYVWTEEGERLIDFTAGWGVTCLGHSHPVIVEALKEQSEKIMQNQNSGLTYSPARARLLSLMRQILPAGLTRVFFSNSGAEANDAAINPRSRSFLLLGFSAPSTGISLRSLPPHPRSRSFPGWQNSLFLCYL
jgi:acetylornithine/N-succinyldiaminopimelate aminotransferase